MKILPDRKADDEVIREEQVTIEYEPVEPFASAIEKAAVNPQRSACNEFKVIEEDRHSNIMEIM